MTTHPFETAPDFVEPFEVWRVWRVVKTAGTVALASVVKDAIWPNEAPLVAECRTSRSRVLAALRGHPHPAPASRCECGIYGAGLEIASQYLKDSIPTDLARVLGRVALWGEIVECERGFRASHAYPTALYVPTDEGKRAHGRAAEIAAALRRYRVPVQLIANEAATVAALGHAA